VYRKLVRLDPNNGGRFSEVDLICVHRTAAALKGYIERCIDPDDDPYEIRGQVLPLCEGALDGSLKMPLDFSTDIPLKYPSREGWLPESFGEYFAKFCVPATGSRGLDIIEPVIKDGEKYAYMYFEEPGDWPEVVEQHEREVEERFYTYMNATPEEIERRRTNVPTPRQMMLDAEEKVSGSVRFAPNSKLAIRIGFVTISLIFKGYLTIFHNWRVVSPLYKLILAELDQKYRSNLPFLLACQISADITAIPLRLKPC
jgi:hypothetical protein